MALVVEKLQITQEGMKNCRLDGSAGSVVDYVN